MALRLPLRMEEGLLPHSGGLRRRRARAARGRRPQSRRGTAALLRGHDARAERLILTRAAERTKRGKPVPRTPSRFLEDIPAELVDAIDLRGPLPAAPKEVQQAKARSFFASMTELLGEAEPDGQAPGGSESAPR